MEGSETVALTGSGSAGDPFVPSAILDPDADNLLTEGVDGLAYFESTNLKRAEAPARGTMYFLSGGYTISPLPTPFIYDNIDVADMTTDSNAYFVTPYAGFYRASVYFRINPRSIGADPAYFRARIHDEDSGGEVACGTTVAVDAITLDGIGITVVTAGDCANLAAGRRIGTTVASNVSDATIYDGSDLAWGAKFSMEYVGPHI